MATIKYIIPIHLNTESPQGITNIGNCFIKDNMIWTMNQNKRIVFTPEPYSMKIVRQPALVISSDPNAYWAFPIKLKTVMGNEIYHHNINDMTINTYNDIRRIIKFRTYNPDQTFNEMLYIDPPVGYYDTNDPNDEFSYVSSMEYIDNCVDNFPVSTEGQIITVSVDKDNKIYSFYQLGEEIIVFSNKGIFSMRPIEAGFFELTPIPFVNSFDVKSASSTFATEDICWFLYENNLYIIIPENPVKTTKLGGINLLSQLIDKNDKISILGCSDMCVINNVSKKKCVFYALDTGFSGICDFYIGGLEKDKFIIREFSEQNEAELIKIQNELNCSRLKRLKAVVLKGFKPPIYAKLEVINDLNPNCPHSVNLFFNMQGIAYTNIVFTGLNIRILVRTDSIMTRTDAINAVEIYYEFVEKQVPYAYEQVKSVRNK